MCFTYLENCSKCHRSVRSKTVQSSPWRNSGNCTHMASSYSETPHSFIEVANAPATGPLNCRHCNMVGPAGGWANYHAPSLAIPAHAPAGYVPRITVPTTR